MNTPQLMPPPQLEKRIIYEIKRQKDLLDLKKRLFWSASGLSGSLAAFTFAYRDFLTKTAHSDFLSFLSLGFSDFRLVSTNAADYFLSLAEALPIISFGLLGLTGLFVLFLGYKLLRYAFEIRRFKVG
jgi:hypothetical protein